MPETVEAWLPEGKVARLALKVVIFGVYASLGLLPFFLLALVLDR